MKAKDLIILLSTIDPEAEVMTPGFDECYATNNFLLKRVGILFNTQDRTTHCAPHDTTEIGAPGSVDGYLLDGDW